MILESDRKATIVNRFRIVLALLRRIDEAASIAAVAGLSSNTVRKFLTLLESKGLMAATMPANCWALRDFETPSAT